MKKSIILVLFILGIILIACQVDPVEDLQNTELDLMTETTENTTETDGHTDTMRGGGPPSQEAITLQKRMAWAAYATAAVLHDNGNSEIRPYFTDLIVAGTDVFSVNNLLGANPADGGLFKTEFEATMAQILCNFSQDPTSCPEPDQTINTPPPPPLDGGEFMPSDIPTLVEQFISYLIIDNCLELYFPDGLTLGLGTNIVTSVAHPLNANTGNYGIKRTGKYDGYHVFVDQSYMNQRFPNVVVVRPWGFESIECDYSSYNVNFDDFLN